MVSSIAMRQQQFNINNSLLVISFLNELELICLYTSIAIVSTQMIQLLLPSTTNSIQY